MKDDFEWVLSGEKKFNPSQPRVPAGSSEGGQWTSTGDGGQATGEVKYKDVRKFVPKVKFTETADEYLNNAVRRGDLPREIGTAIYGIRWARQTGRLSGTAEISIRRLGVDDYIKLVVEVANRTNVSGDVPRILNEMYQ